METFKALFSIASENAIIVIDALALVIIVFAAIEAFIKSMRGVFSPLTGHERRDVWLRFARWLVAGLTFQLAADIIESSITTRWESVARLGAVAVIRTFLNYFLERDVAEARERQHQPESPPRA
ncbi:MAG TPA: DUF1622 domain-containing protein [Gemmatimonadaceae bacterium]|nr:DUF1622 domain-containing protein [Gemmatimonadaceae bacterium]